MSTWNSFDLPPTTRAKPLPVRENPSKAASSSKKRKHRHDEYKNDDTPKAFARLMQLQTARKHFNGLDDGEPRKGKKRKINNDAAPRPQSTEVSHALCEQPQPPTILPGERLADFSARVDAALPVAGLARKTKRGQERQTKLEKRMQRMQTEWRKEDAKSKEREEEEKERLEEEADERGNLFEEKIVKGLQGVNRKNGKRRRRRDERGDVDEDDPWAKLKEGELPRRVWDVVQAPPDLKVVPKEKFKVRNGAMVEVKDVPQAAGSLRRREELVGARTAVIEGYRRMMEDKRMQV